MQKVRSRDQNLATSGFNLDLPKRTHIAIMRKSWGLTQKLLTGEKTIESRWYKNKYKPWDQIDAGDTIYFKDSGRPVTVQARVSKVLQFENLNPDRVWKILREYGRKDGLGVAIEEIDKYFDRFKEKKYCLIIFLGEVEAVAEPFEIDKSGFGAMSSWLVVDDIEKIRR
jgi:ASC-1-like (ASCH) protein